MPSKAKIVLALDPATFATGWAVFKVTDKGTKLVKFGHWKIPKDISYPERMNLFRKNVIILIEKLKPTHFVVERPFMGINAKTFLALAGGYGILCQISVEKGLPLISMPPQEAKIHFLGNNKMKGSKSKTAIRKHLESFYNVKFENDDESDAVATGLTAIEKYLSQGIDEHY